MFNNSIMTGLLRPSIFINSAFNAARRGNNYENVKVHRLKYRGMAKAKRKEARRIRMQGMLTPKDTGEEMPPFFLGPRVKLMYRVLQDHKNCARVGRKPMPEDMRKMFVAKSKEYHAYKVLEMMHIEQENVGVLKAQMTALDAIVHLPDYLMDECLDETGDTHFEDVDEFSPSMMYLEQQLRLYPREITARWKLFPALEESFMRIDDNYNSGDVNK